MLRKMAAAAATVLRQQSSSRASCSYASEWCTSGASCWSPARQYSQVHSHSLGKAWSATIPHPAKMDSSVMSAKSCMHLQLHRLPQPGGCSLVPSGLLRSCLRMFASKARLKPKHVGGKMKTCSAFKSRFKVTATGKIRHMRPGHRHKRFPKGSDRNRRLRKGKNLFSTYANTMKKLGFKMRTYGT